MEARKKYILLKTVQDNNIIPITSACNMNCLFCSHQFNPPSVETYSYGVLDLELIKELISYLSPKGPVILGESATKIIEGEPFSHPQISSILSFLRQKWPRKNIRITTNGSYLTEDMINFIDHLGNIELNISLNCSNPEERKIIMKDKKPEIVFAAFALLDKYNISYTASIVALPHIRGWASIEKTISFLSTHKTKYVRIFLPGFTYLTPEKYRFSSDLYRELKKLIQGLNTSYDLPLILEPPLLEDFYSRIIGIISESPAVHTGLKKGDIIVEINGIKPKTRVETFHLLNKFQEVKLKIKRKNRFFTFSFHKNQNEKSGIILNYDLHPDMIKEIERTVRMTDSRNIILITSKAARHLLNGVVLRINKTNIEKNVTLVDAENYFFGGSIMSAGLLVNSDIIHSIKKADLINRFGLILLPGIVYDIYGNDLTGSSYHYLEEKLGSELAIIN